jgi:hypothetical protein
MLINLKNVKYAVEELIITAFRAVQHASEPANVLPASQDGI